MSPRRLPSPLRRLICAALGLALAGSDLFAIRPANSDILILERPQESPVPGLRDLKDLGNPPVPQLQIRPEYPEHLQAAPLKAEILVGFIVDSSGGVPHAFAIRSTNPWFDRGAIEAVKQWRFRPGTVRGRAVATRMQVPITFDARASGPGAWNVRVLSDASRLPEHLRYDSPPRVLDTSFAAYPFEALLENRGAAVTIRALIDAEGKVTAIAFPEPPEPAFAGAITAMMNHWLFNPARLKAKPVPAVVFMDLVFSPSGNSCAPVSPAARTILKELEKETPEILTLSDLDAAPRLLAHHKPIHPPSLRAAGTEGDALVEFFIDETGNVQLPRVVEATHPEFGYAAVQAVATWWFEPPLRHGKPGTVRARVPVYFDLTEPVGK